MKQIIELAQEQLSKEQSALRELQNDREDVITCLIEVSKQIPVQEAKVQSLDKNLSELYSRYGYPGGQSGCASVSPAPATKRTKPCFKDEDFE